MNDNPAIAFRPAFDQDDDFLYKLPVATMKEYVNQTWGWDNAFQELVFHKNFIPAQVQVITCAGRDMGMLMLEERSEDFPPCH